MAEQSSDKKPQPEDRRRFLRRSIRGALPLLAGLGEDPSGEYEPGGPGSPATSPPPENTGEAPDQAKTAMDRRHEEFQSDNPAMTVYPSD
jgi:hypothetical protein